MTPTVSSSKTLFRGFFDVKCDRLVRHDGQTLDYTSIILPWSASIVLAQTKEGLYILNREYRHPAGLVLLGCPGGRIENDEDPRHAAARELLEETGYCSDHFSLIGSCYPFPSLCNQKIFFFHAKDAYRKGDRNPDPFEFIQTELKSEEEIRNELRSGSPIDSLLCAALWYKNVHTS